MANFIARSTLWGTVQTGPLFGRLSFDEQQAVMWHEKGHIRHLHAWIRLWWIVTGKCFRKPGDFDAMCVEQEFDADRYAAFHGHTRAMIRVLSRLSDNGDPAYPTPHERIQRLMRYV